MAVVVRSRPRRRYPGLRLVRRVRGFLGGLLILVSNALIIVVAGIPALLLVGTGSGGGDLPESDRWVLGDVVRGWVLAIVLWLSARVAGRQLQRGGRRVVLWLRRFRDADGIAVVEAALDHIGRSWRVVTLDDRTATPVGVATGLRLSAGLVRLLSRAWRSVQSAPTVGLAVARVCVIGIVLTAVWAVYADRPRATLDGLVRPWDEWSGPPQATVLRVLVGVILAVFALMLGFVALSLVLIPLTGVFTTVGSVSAGVARADAVKTRRIDGREDVATVATQVGWAGTDVLAPRLTVVTVATPVWQESVLALARPASVVLIDVSAGSDNLLWEIRQMAQAGEPVVFVGHRDALARLSGPGQGELERALDGQEVLSYTSGALGRVRFQAALFADLEDAVRRRRRGRVDVRGGLLAAGSLAVVGVTSWQAVVLVGSLL